MEMGGEMKKIIKTISIFFLVYLIALLIAYKTAILLPIHDFELAVIANLLCINIGVATVGIIAMWGKPRN